MGFLKVIVQKRVLYAIERTADWYRFNLNNSAANHFKDDIYNTIEILSNMPTIGRIESSYRGRAKYYSFLAHPKYRIVYRYTNTTLYIVAIRATMMSY